MATYIINPEIISAAIDETIVGNPSSNEYILHGETVRKWVQTVFKNAIRKYPERFGYIISIQTLFQDRRLLESAGKFVRYDYPKVRIDDTVVCLVVHVIQERLRYLTDALLSGELKLPSDITRLSYIDAQMKATAWHTVKQAQHQQNSMARYSHVNDLVANPAGSAGVCIGQPSNEDGQVPVLVRGLVQVPGMDGPVTIDVQTLVQQELGRMVRGGGGGGHSSMGATFLAGDGWQGGGGDSWQVGGGRGNDPAYMTIVDAYHPFNYHAMPSRKERPANQDEQLAGWDQGHREHHGSFNGWNVYNLRDQQALEYESALQSHCVGWNGSKYVREVLDGNIIILHLAKDEHKFTVEIQVREYARPANVDKPSILIHVAPCWRIVQIKEYNNAAPTPALNAEIRGLLETFKHIFSKAPSHDYP